MRLLEGNLLFRLRILVKRNGEGSLFLGNIWNVWICKKFLISSKEKKFRFVL